MELIKINPIPNTTKVEVVFNQASQRYVKLQIDKTHVRTVAWLSDGGGVELIMTDDKEQLTYNVVDEVNGNTNITSNEILFNELTAIF